MARYRAKVLSVFRRPPRARGTFEWLSGHQGSAMRWWGRSLDAGERIGLPYQIALTEFDVDRLSGHRERLERVAVVFTSARSWTRRARATRSR